MATETLFAPAPRLRLMRNAIQLLFFHFLKNYFEIYFKCLCDNSNLRLSKNKSQILLRKDRRRGLGLFIQFLKNSIFLMTP